MKISDRKKIIAVNLALWLFAMLLHPLVQLLPTGSGDPPKLFSLLIPIFFVMLAGASTHLLSAAFKKANGE